ncbi:MAG: menaquinone biosynthesis decarboxylase [Bacteroidota bacterium]
MIDRSLEHFITKLENSGELIRVKGKVSPHLEMTEIVDRFSKQPDGGKAVLFEDSGTAFPVLMNVMGSDKRMQQVLGVDSWEGLQQRLNSYLDMFTTPPVGFFDKIKMAWQLKKMAGILPKTKKGKALCQQVVMEVPNLSELPILTCWPHDGGKFITLPVVITKDPHTGIRNVGMYRMQQFTDQMTGMHWHRHKVAARHYREYKELGKRMPVAVVLGGDPVYTYCATAPLPDNMDEFMLAGFLRQAPVELIKARTQDIEVPADADIVIEGYIDPQEDPVWEGPFGDHTGFYSLPDWYPKFHVTAITHKKNAIYPATIVGIPPMEDAYLGKATEQLFLKPIQFAIGPEIVDLHLPVQGVAHNLVLVKIRKTYPGQAVKIMNALWGAGQMMFSKVLVVLDASVELTDYKQVFNAITHFVNPETDMHTSKGPMDILDHASPTFSFGSKVGLDATAPLPEEGEGTAQPAMPLQWEGELPEELVAFIPIANTGSCPLWVGTLRQEVLDKKRFIQNWLKDSRFSGGGSIVLVDEQVDANDTDMIGWLALGNLEPHRDLYFHGTLQAGNWRMLVDATMKIREDDNYKRQWPNVITMAPEIVEKVDMRWDELQLGPFLSSPSKRFSTLSMTQSYTIPSRENE